MSEKIKDMKANIVRLLSENTELKRERDEAREDVMKLQDIKRKHEHEELVAAQENDRLKQERDEARELERVAIVSWEEEHQRALREGQRVVEAREQNAKLRDIAQKAIELAVQYYDGPCERDAAKLRVELDQLMEGGRCPVCTPEQKCWECADDVSQEGVE
jgi:hypothetical protein